MTYNDILNSLLYSYYVHFWMALTDNNHDTQSMYVLPNYILQF